MDCQTRVNGKYASRFTLKNGQPGQVKPAVRPMAVNRYTTSWLFLDMPYIAMGCCKEEQA